MNRRIVILILTIVTFLASCQSGLPPTEILIEVTRVVTVVVTPDPNQGPLPLNTPEATQEAQPVVTEAPIVTETPTMTPTPDAFPAPVIGQIFVAEQQFERGRMFWLRPIDQIWVITIEGENEYVWQVAEDNFEEGMPESDPEFVPADENLMQPIRGFGLLWRENAEIREQLGWATADEVGYLANYEYHYGGSVDESNNYTEGPGYHQVETLAREIIRFNEGIWTWEVSESSE